MSEENRSQELRLKNIDEIRNYSFKEINQNELMSKKHNKSLNYRVLNYIDHLLIVILTITVSSSVCAFPSLIGIPIGITSSAIRLKICAITAGIKKYKSIIKKKKQKHGKLLLVVKSNLNSKALISNALIDSVISHDEFVLMNYARK